MRTGATILAPTRFMNVMGNMSVGISLMDATIVPSRVFGVLVGRETILAPLARKSVIVNNGSKSPANVTKDTTNDREEEPST